MFLIVRICELLLCADGAAKEVPLLSCRLVAWIHVSHVVFYNSLLKTPNQCLDYKPNQCLHTMVGAGEGGPQG